MLVAAALYWVGIGWFVSGMRRLVGGQVEQPFVSVVVAARDEAERIGACLQRLATQEYPHYEILVVDDGSRDGTPDLVEALAKGDGRLRLLRSTEGGSKKAALTLGIAAAKGDIIATTDADCLVGSGWLRGMVAQCEDDVGMVIGFSQIGAEGDRLGARGSYEALDFLNLMGCIWGSSGHGHPMAASGQNLVFRRSAYDEVNGYQRVLHRASGDDVLLMQMVRTKTRWKIVFCSEEIAFAQHPPAASWRHLLSQRSRWASNAPLMARMDPLFFAYMAVTYSLSWCVVIAPLVTALGGMRFPVLLAVIASKWGGEWLVFRRACRLSRRVELTRYWILWALIQPLHVVVVGALGVVGLFSWKGKRHRWGQAPSMEA